MAQKHAQRYCPVCDRRTLAVARTPNHILHIVLTFVTCSLWLFVWLAVCLLGDPYRCTKCGERV